MSVFGCFELDFDIETVRFLYAKNKAHKTPFYVNEPSNTRSSSSSEAPRIARFECKITKNWGGTQRIFEQSTVLAMRMLRKWEINVS